MLQPALVMLNFEQMTDLLLSTADQDLQFWRRSGSGFATHFFVHLQGHKSVWPVIDQCT